MYIYIYIYIYIYTHTHIDTSFTSHVSTPATQIITKTYLNKCNTQQTHLQRLQHTPNTPEHTLVVCLSPKLAASASVRPFPPAKRWSCPHVRTYVLKSDQHKAPEALCACHSLCMPATLFFVCVTLSLYACTILVCC